MKNLALAFAILSLISCDESEQIQKDLEKTLKEGIESISSNPRLPLDELKKLSQLEYKSVAFPIDISPLEMEEALTDLGKDRWNCESIFPRPRSAPDKPEIVAICKRTPETVLRYVPGGMIGK